MRPAHVLPGFVEIGESNLYEGFRLKRLLKRKTTTRDRATGTSSAISKDRRRSMGGLANELQAGGAEQAFARGSADGGNGTAVAEIFAQVFQPVDVGNKRGFGLDDEQLARFAARSDLKNQSCVGAVLSKS